MAGVCAIGFLGNRKDCNVAWCNDCCYVRTTLCGLYVRNVRCLVAPLSIRHTPLRRKWRGNGRHVVEVAAAESALRPHSDLPTAPTYAGTGTFVGAYGNEPIVRAIVPCRNRELMLTAYLSH